MTYFLFYIFSIFYLKILDKQLIIYMFHFCIHNKCQIHYMDQKSEKYGSEINRSISKSDKIGQKIFPCLCIPNKQVKGDNKENFPSKHHDKTFQNTWA